MIELSFSSTKHHKADIQLPASKSISNRLLILRALSVRKNRIHNLSKANDTRLMRLCLSQKNNVYDVQDAGTVYRFLLPYLCIKSSKATVTGTLRLMQRPIEPLIDALKTLGAHIELKRNRVEITGGQIVHHKTRVSQEHSSQFASALLLSGAAFPNGLQLKLTGKAVSEPYLHLTLDLLKIAGVAYIIKNNTITIQPQTLQLPECRVENDWSSASFFYQVVALHAHKLIRFKNLSLQSAQADAVCALLFESLGVQTTSYRNDLIIKHKEIKQAHKLVFHCTSFPDIVPSLAVTCAALGISAQFKDIGHLRNKESNRIEALRYNLTSCNVKFKVHKNEFSIQSDPIKGRDISIKSFNDHRIAMAFAPLSLVNNKVYIDNKDCVNKSFPGFWTQLKKTGVRIYE
jgi:3-phosphoshikimate 1-carboxyvinyltransferase